MAHSNLKKMACRKRVMLTCAATMLLLSTVAQVQLVNAAPAPQTVGGPIATGGGGNQGGPPADGSIPRVPPPITAPKVEKAKVDPSPKVEPKPNVDTPKEKSNQKQDKVPTPRTREGTSNPGRDGDTGATNSQQPRDQAAETARRDAAQRPTNPVNGANVDASRRREQAAQEATRKAEDKKRREAEANKERQGATSTRREEKSTSTETIAQLRAELRTTTGNDCNACSETQLRNQLNEARKKSQTSQPPEQRREIQQPNTRTDSTTITKVTKNTTTKQLQVMAVQLGVTCNACSQPELVRTVEQRQQQVLDDGLKVIEIFAPAAVNDFRSGRSPINCGCKRVPAQVQSVPVRTFGAIQRFSEVQAVRNNFLSNDVQVQFCPQQIQRPASGGLLTTREINRDPQQLVGCRIEGVQGVILAGLTETTKVQSSSIKTVLNNAQTAKEGECSIVNLLMSADGKTVSEQQIEELKAGDKKLVEELGQGATVQRLCIKEAGTQSLSEESSVNSTLSSKSTTKSTKQEQLRQQSSTDLSRAVQRTN